MQLSTTPTVGHQAPDFTLQTPDNTTLTLNDLKADRTLIIFSRHLG